MAYSQLPERISQAQLPPHSDNKNVVSQISRYNRWLTATGRVLHQPDLADYRDLLLETLAPASARVHLSSIRRSYKTLVENPQHRVALVNYLQQKGGTADFATLKLVDTPSYHYTFPGIACVTRNGDILPFQID